MKILITAYSHEIGQDGETNAITVHYSKSEGFDTLNASTRLTIEDMDEGVTLEDISKKEADKVAIQKIYEWFEMEEKQIILATPQAPL